MNDVRREPYRDEEQWARAQDTQDPLSSLREHFLFPSSAQGGEALYFAGHSLGLQPRAVRTYVQRELDKWASQAVEGHFTEPRPWEAYHELLTPSTARLVGAKPLEVVVMNTLSVNLHLLMVSFYRPTKERFRILVEASAFPSDRYAVASQARFHGYCPEETILALEPRPGESLLREEDLLETLERHGDSIALVLLGQANYLTGQAFDVPAIVRAGHARGCVVGLDLAHGAGNLRLALHEWNVDFAAWCNYKYLNAGPGGLGGIFVHERHAHDASLPRFAGWWGHDKQTRFAMGPTFQPLPGAEGWQLSNPPILQLAALRAAMEPFDAAGMEALSARAARLTGYLEWLLNTLPEGAVEQVTPREPHRRGTMLTLRVPRRASALVTFLQERGAHVDLRNPDIVRVTPVPLYTRHSDVRRLATLFREFFATHVHA
jgi:kynureninase